MAAINRENTPQGKIRAYVTTRMDALNRLANLYSAFKDEYFESYGFIEKLRRNYDQYEINVFKEILKGGIESGIFLVNDLDLTAFAIVIASKGLEYHWAMEKDRIKTEKNINVLLNVLLNGIVKK